MSMAWPLATHGSGRRKLRLPMTSGAVALLFCSVRCPVFSSDGLDPEWVWVWVCLPANGPLNVLIRHFVIAIDLL